MEIEFRTLRAFPRGTMLALLRDAYSFEPRMERDWLENWREADDFFYDRPDIADKCAFVSCLSGEPVGMICWDPRNLPEFAEIGHNCVASRFKRMGVGGAQLREAVRRISAAGARSIRVTTDEGLVPAQRNYESAGFTLTRTRENLYNPDYAGRLMDYEMVLPHHP